MDVLFLLHGFNVKDRGASTTDKLIPYIKPTVLVDDDYGYTVLSVKFVTLHKSRQLAKDIIDNKIAGNRVTLIGHSNGCTIIYKALQLITKFFPDEIVFINPALKPTITFPKGNYNVSVFYSKDDLACKAAGVLNILPESITSWGNMGAVGYKGATDARVANYDESGVFKQLTGKDVEFGHSTIFESGIIDEMGKYINRLIHG